MIQDAYKNAFLCGIATGAINVYKITGDADKAGMVLCGRKRDLFNDVGLKMRDWETIQEIYDGLQEIEKSG